MKEDAEKAGHKVNKPYPSSIDHTHSSTTRRRGAPQTPASRTPRAGSSALSWPTGARHFLIKKRRESKKYSRKSLLLLSDGSVTQNFELFMYARNSSYTRKTCWTQVFINPSNVVVSIASSHQK